MIQKCAFGVERYRLGRRGLIFSDYPDLRAIAPSRIPTGAANKKGSALRSPFRFVAEWTGLEPATPGVTGRYSNQLNYHS